MTLDDVEGEVFGCMVHWFYTEEVELSADEFSGVRDLPKLGKLWILAERCLIPDLQNDALALIHRILWGDIFIDGAFPGDPYPDSLKQLINVVYNPDAGGEQHDVLRKLLMDFWAFQPSNILEEWIPHMPQALIVGVTLALSKAQDGGRGKSLIPEAAEYQVEVPGKKKKVVGSTEKHRKASPTLKPRVLKLTPAKRKLES